MTDNNIAAETVIPANIESLTRLTHLMYALQAISIVFGVSYLLGIASLIIAYVKYPEVRGNWLETHFRWQINTFWYGLLWFVVGGLLMLVGIGAIILIANYIWLLYRVIKGWLALGDGKSVMPHQFGTMA